MALSLTHTFLSLLFFLLSSSPFSSATTTQDDNLLLSDVKFPETQAKKLIRGLNLFPKHDVNTGAAGDSPAGISPAIVEKRFKFPYIGDSGASVQNLGHHAGYYKLPHSKDARYILLSY